MELNQSVGSVVDGIRMILISGTASDTNGLKGPTYGAVITELYELGPACITGWRV